MTRREREPWVAMSSFVVGCAFTLIVFLVFMSAFPESFCR